MIASRLFNYMVQLGKSGVLLVHAAYHVDDLALVIHNDSPFNAGGGSSNCGSCGVAEDDRGKP